jgi:hypothetical protein
MKFGFPWSESFTRDMADKEFRDEFVADQIRTRIALLIRALREQPDRNWSQTQLARKLSKPQSVVSRLEDPDYGKMSLQTLLEVAAAYNLPLWVDFPEWEDWARLIQEVPTSETSRRSFDVGALMGKTIDGCKNDFCKVLDLETYRGKRIASATGDSRLDFTGIEVAVS